MNITSSFLLLTILSTLALNAIADTSPSDTKHSLADLVNLSDVPGHPSTLWTGIGRLRSSRNSYCTATLIDTRNTAAYSDSAPAYIITSQRCLNTDSAGEYSYYGGIQRNVHAVGMVHFNNFENKLGQTKSYAFKKIAWQSDLNLDIALIELKAPLSQLIRAGVHPLKIAPTTPPSGTEIIAFGIPKRSHLSASQCTQLPAVAIASAPWVNTNVLANNCADITHGGRGGPVLDKASNELISVTVASTYAKNGNEKCLDLAPCEIKEGESHWSANTHYSAPVSFLNTCFSQGELDADALNCDLNNRLSIVFDHGQQLPARLLEKVATDKAPEPDTFNIPFTVKTPFYRYKYTHNLAACQTAHGYSAQTPSVSAIINLKVDNRVGMHFLCIIGQPEADSALTAVQLNNAKIMATDRYASTANITPADYVHRQSTNSDKYSISFTHVSPFFERIVYKYGHYDELDCTDLQGYITLFPIGYDGYRLPVGDQYPDLVGVNLPEYSTLMIPPTNPTEASWFGQTVKINITVKDHAIKVCTISYNRESIAMTPLTYVIKPL